jgi:excisionase family DNA binding protein
MGKKRETVQLPEFVSSREACRILGVTSQTLRRWAKRGQISAIRTPGGHFRYCLGQLIVAPTPTPAALPQAKPKKARPAVSEKIPAQNAMPAQLDLVEMVKAVPPPAVISAEALRHQIERLAKSSAW